MGGVVKGDITSASGVSEGLRSLSSVEERLEFVDRVVRARKEKREAEFKSSVSSILVIITIWDRNEVNVVASDEQVDEGIEESAVGVAVFARGAFAIKVQGWECDN